MKLNSDQATTDLILW